MHEGRIVTIELTKPEIELKVMLEEWWGVEPPMYNFVDQWLAFEPSGHADLDNLEYWIQLDGTVYSQGMEVGRCGEVAAHYIRDDDV